jgi:SAM-dependent methyltransferase
VTDHPGCIMQVRGGLHAAGKKTRCCTSPSSWRSGFLNDRACSPATPPTGSADLLELPFDQYQRYGALALAADRLRARLGRRLTILDCGDWDGLAERFCPGDWVAWMDPTGHGRGRYGQADGGHIPFADASFDLVACLDTLEHVEAERRPTVVAELRRVARLMVVVAVPRADDDAPAAERALYEYIWEVLGGKHLQLAEHLERGLPRAAEARAWLGAPGWRVADVPSGLLDDWRTMMLAKHILLRTEGGDEVHRALDRRYNERHGAVDPAVPAYRQVLFAARDEASDLPKLLVDELPEVRRGADGADVAVAFATLLAAHARRAGADVDLMAAVRGELDAGYAASRALNRTILGLQGEVGRERAEVARLRDLVEGYRRGRVMRLMTAAARLRRRLGL